jgi:hypothetical protein
LIVIDASALAKVLIEKGPSADAVRRRLADEALVAPSLVDAEVLSVLRGLTRGGKLPGPHDRLCVRHGEDGGAPVLDGVVDQLVDLDREGARRFASRPRRYGPSTLPRAECRESPRPVRRPIPLLLIAATVRPSTWSPSTLGSGVGRPRPSDNVVGDRPQAL